MRTVNKFLLKLRQRNHVHETQQTQPAIRTQTGYETDAKRGKTSKQGSAGSMNLVPSEGKDGTGARRGKTTQLVPCAGKRA